MAVLNGSSASPRNLCVTVGSTTLSTVYTAPGYSANVTSPSATAYIKEISLCNISGGSVTITLNVNSQPIISGMTLNPNETKILTGLNMMLIALGTIQVQASTANAIVFQISGVEVQ